VSTDPFAALKPIREGTPLEDHLEEAGLLVKREDLSCPPPGPPFSKTRGVLAHITKRYKDGARVFGALDTFHSQAGHAVAYACRLVGAQCINYFPVYKREQDHTFPAPWPMELRPPQLRSQELGATLVGLQAGRSALLYHSAKRDAEAQGGYMMPNALKLPETVEETAAEVVRTFELADRAQFEVLRSSPWLISASSATIASGVIKGLAQIMPKRPPILLHMGYSRSSETVRDYIAKRIAPDTGFAPDVTIIDEGYAYADQAKAGPTPPWPCNPYYDLKALRWWLREGRERYGRAVFWNIG
jgi:hypothetical protein